MFFNQMTNQIENSFHLVGDFVKRDLVLDSNKHAVIFYLDMLANEKLIEDHIISKLLFFLQTDSLEKDIKNGMQLSVAEFSFSSLQGEIELGILTGDTILFIEGLDEAVIVSSKGFPSRGVATAETEIVIEGSKEAFSEVLRINTTLLRRRIRDSNLKIEQLKIGRRSKTDVAMVYLSDVVREDIYEETKSRLESIDVDMILDSGSLQELTEKNWLSPFPQMQGTERPDKAASAIAEGRIVIVVDNSPFVLMVPATLNVFFQTSEDYYQAPAMMSFLRVLRYMAAILTMTLPGFFLAMALYHPSMIPTPLLLKIIEGKQAVPFPLLVEMMMMTLTFELLREAGIRLPSSAGATFGTVGGIVVGTAAVEAGLVSPFVVIIVALTGIASFAIPNYALLSGFRMSAFLVTISSAVLGLLGFWLSILFIIVHLCSLKSFGFPYLFPFVSGDVNHFSDLKDSLLRFPLFMMEKRPFFANPHATYRMPPGETEEKLAADREDNLDNPVD